MDTETAIKKYAETLERKVYMTDPEGAVYVGMSVNAFREWSRRVGARRKLGDGPKAKVVVIREVIDRAIMEGKENNG